MTQVDVSGRGTIAQKVTHTQKPGERGRHGSGNWVGRARIFYQQLNYLIYIINTSYNNQTLCDTIWKRGWEVLNILLPSSSSLEPSPPMPMPNISPPLLSPSSPLTCLVCPSIAHHIRCQLIVVFMAHACCVSTCFHPSTPSVHHFNHPLSSIAPPPLPRQHYSPTPMIIIFSFLAGIVADMLATCLPNTKFSPIFSHVGLCRRHQSSIPDFPARFLCWLLPTLGFPANFSSDHEL
jgi:hypothetical protein